MQVNHLPDVVKYMRHTAQENIEAIANARIANGGVRLAPILSRLRVKRADDHRYGFVEALQRFGFCGRMRVVEFAVAVAHIACPRDLRADVVIQIARQVQHQMAVAVAVIVWLRPKLFLGQCLGPLMHFAQEFFVVFG